MLRPRWRKVWADLWDNKARTLLVIASIAIGVFAVGMIAGAYVIIPEGMDSSYAGANPANVKIVTTPFDDDFVETVRRVDGVGAAEGRRVVTVRVRTGSGEWANLELVALPDFADQQINALLPLRGAAAPDDEEVVLVGDALAEIGVELGDALEIQLVDDTIKYLPVVGVTEDLTAGIEGILNKNRGFITFDSLEWLHEPANYNQLYVTVAENPNDPAHIQRVANEVGDQLEASGRPVLNTRQFERDQHPLGYIVQAVLGVLSLLGVLIVFLSSSLIANTLVALLNQHVRQIGVMKLVGARRSQIIGMYLTLIFIFGVIALLFAIPLGGWAAFALSHMLAELLNIIVAEASLFHIVPLAVVLQVIIALVVPLMAGVLPVLNGSRITVQEAISSSGLEGSQGSKGWLDRQLGSIRSQSGTLLISIRNTFRRKGRLVLTLFTLALGGAIFIAVFNVQIALDQKVEEISLYFNADVNLDFDRSYRIEEVEQYALAVPGVVHVEGWASTGAELLDADDEVVDNMTILAPPAGTELVVPIMLEGRWLLPGDRKAITVNEAFWSVYPDLRPGDSLRLKIDGDEDDWIVVGIYQYAGIDRLFAYANYAPLSEVLNESFRASTYRLVTENHDLAYQEQLSAQLDEQFRDRGFHVREVEAGGSFAADITELMGVVITILIILALLTAVVGSIGMAGTLSMNVLERTREIGVLRAIGAYDRVVINLVVVEGMLIGLISYTLGALLSFPITSLLSDIISYAMFNSPANFAFTPSGFFIWSIAVFILSALASVVPARSAARMTIREVLAYE